MIRIHVHHMWPEASCISSLGFSILSQKRHLLIDPVSHAINSLDPPGHHWCLVIQLPVTPKLRHVGSVPQEIRTSPTQLVLPRCSSPDNSWAPWPALTPSVPQLLFQPLLGSLWSLTEDGEVLSMGLCLVWLESSLVLSVWESGVVDSRKQGTGLFNCLGGPIFKCKKKPFGLFMFLKYNKESQIGHWATPVQAQQLSTAFPCADLEQKPLKSWWCCNSAIKSSKALHSLKDKAQAP